MRTCETGSKGQTGSKPPLEVVWLDVNRMRIGLECTFFVGARVCIKSNQVRIQFRFMDKCGQAFSARKRLSSICLLAHSYDTHALAQWAQIVALFFRQPMQWQMLFTLLGITLHSPA